MIDIEVEQVFLQIKCQHICKQVQYEYWSMHCEHMYS